MTVNYRSISTLQIIGFLTAVIYHVKLPRYFYNIGHRCPLFAGISIDAGLSAFKKISQDFEESGESKELSKLMDFHLNTFLLFNQVPYWLSDILW